MEPSVTTYYNRFKLNPQKQSARNYYWKSHSDSDVKSAVHFVH